MENSNVVYIVKIYVKGGFETPFVEATRLNRNGTKKEPGNIKFDLFQQQEKSGEFLLFEVYESEDAVNAHKKTDHYARWRDTVEVMMEKPREGVRYLPVLADSPVKG